MGFQVADTTAYQKGQQLVEDLKEKYETSDHPVIHKVGESFRSAWYMVKRYHCMKVAVQICIVNM
jgi:hypothetical protein